MRIVLVGGPSAIGKHSFIEALRESQDLRRRFGISENARYFTNESGHVLRAEFHRLLDAVYRETPAAEVIVKWQAFVKPALLQRLSSTYPETTFRGICLWLDEQ